MMPMNNSLFLKLYLSIIAVIVASFFMVGLVLDLYEGDTGEADFIHDITFIAEQLEGISASDAKIKAQVLQQLSDFDIRFLSETQKQQFIASHEFLEHEQGFDVYAMDEDKLAGLRGGLLIFDGDRVTTVQDIQENVEFILLLSFIFIAIALVLYWSVKRIATEVNRLSDASRALADGQLDTRVNESIPVPLAQMAESFNHMASSLQHAQQQQQTMANAIAHELRTPLTRMQLALGLLNEQNHDQFSRQLHQDIRRYAEEMEALANDTLTLQRLDYDNAKVNELCRLDELIKLRLEDIKELYPQRKIGLKLSPVTFRGNPRYLQLIVDNLTTNACKYADSQVQITLGVFGDKCVLSVADDGEGVSPQQRRQILEPFTRLDNSRSRQTGGYGLGLAIVNTIVKKMDASLSIAGSELGGAEFKVVLPMSTE